ncbi:MAG: C40 family peptidase [Alicyclobacillaceae bacterium]|nr:C40 family peptidase [Alicyclobacillaceae bacterium]
MCAAAGVALSVVAGQAWLAAPAIAHASTSSPVFVRAVQAVYLRSSAALGHNTIRLEGAGTRFTVIPGSTSGWWHVLDPRGSLGYVIRDPDFIQPLTSDAGAPKAGSGVAAGSNSSPSSAFTTTAALPPGVTLDPSIRPLAPLSATWQQKLDAILQVAESKLGTPYEWGHNEDRGQTGFDCSNFVEYVYHHALGYKFSTASRVQNSSVGWLVPIQDMRSPDLLVFNNGGHVGIYAGNGTMIQEGSGLGKVGYLSVKPGSYWGNHLTAVKRMF